MEKLAKKQKSNSILVKILVPMILVLLLQTVIYAVTIYFNNTFDRMSDMSYRQLNIMTEYRKNYIQNEFITKWMKLDNLYSSINNVTEDVLTAHNATYQDLVNGDADTSTAAIDAISDTLLANLRLTSTTGIFAVFGNNHVTTDKYGLYFKDSDPNRNNSQYSDVMIAIAPLGYSNPYKLSDTERNEMFRFSKQDADWAKFYSYPYQTKASNDSLSYVNCGWWSEPFHLNNQSEEVLTYSVPLVSKSGTLYGVIGIDINKAYLYQILPFSEIHESSTGIYLFGKAIPKSTGGMQYRAWVAGHSDLTVLNILSNKEFDRVESVTDQISRLKPHKGDDLYMCYQPMTIYNTNTPFVQETWFVISIIDGKTLLEDVYRLGYLLLIAFIMSIVLGVVIIVLAAVFFSRPVIRLTAMVKAQRATDKIELPRTNIREIDELTASITVLSSNVMESETKLSKLIELSKMPVAAFDYNPTVNYLYTSKNINNVLRLNDTQYYTPESFGKLIESLKSTLYEETGSVLTYRYDDIDGHTRWIEARLIEMPDPDRKLGVLVDVTQDYNEKQKLLRERNYDSLTNIFNRRAFYDKIDSIFLDETLKTAAFIMLDLDNLKYINDSYGHDFGDQYIRAAAEIMRASLARCQRKLYGRRSGDEFYIFIYGYDSEAILKKDIDMIHHAFLNSNAEMPDGSQVKIRVSGGVSLYPKDSNDYNDLIKYADYAMYETKTTLKGEFRYFNIESYTSNSYLLRNKEELFRLIEQELITYHFQPIVSLKTGVPYAYEALMRSLLDSLKSPHEILSIAKTHFKLNQIERVTFFKAMETYAMFHSEFGDNKIFVNSISSQCMTDDEWDQFRTDYASYLDKIVVEFTEHEKAVDTITQQKLAQIRHWNGEIALDDYGTGYNGEVVLLEHAPNYIKLDMSLVRNIDKDNDRRQMVQGILKYVRSKNIKTIAEGVETEGELIELIRLGCDYAQGFLLGRPTPRPMPVSAEHTSLIVSTYRSVNSATPKRRRTDIVSKLL